MNLSSLLGKLEQVIHPQRFTVNILHISNAGLQSLALSRT